MAPPDAASTVEAAVRSATTRLLAAGIEGAGRDARLLVAAAVGVAQTDLILRPERVLCGSQHQRLRGFIERRTRHEPVSRILGEREFYGRVFEVTPDTLDPRPDSETLIDAVLEVIDSEGGRSKPLRMIDIGTGTGCLLVSLLCELPAVTGVGIDVSPGALEVARRNAGRMGVSDRAEFRLQAASTACDTFDMLISNPPYIPSGEIAGLQEDVRAFDPMLALDGGPDGLQIYRQIATQLTAIVPAGWAFFEVGAGQAPDLQRLLSEALGQSIGNRRLWTDLGGHQRCVAVEIQR